MEPKKAHRKNYRWHDVIWMFSRQWKHDSKTQRPLWRACDLVISSGYFISPYSPIVFSLHISLGNSCQYSLSLFQWNPSSRYRFALNTSVAHVSKLFRKLLSVCIYFVTQFPKGCTSGFDSWFGYI